MCSCMLQRLQLDLIYVILFAIGLCYRNTALFTDLRLMLFYAIKILNCIFAANDRTTYLVPNEVHNDHHWCVLLFVKGI